MAALLILVAEAIGQPGRSRPAEANPGQSSQLGAKSEGGRMIENRILAKNRQGLRALVFQLVFPSPELIELAAQAGFDAVHLDGEHGAFTPESVDLAGRVAHGCGLTVLARVPNLQSSTLNLWLDRGVQGIIGPHVETADEARALAAGCRYPPDGERSWGGGRGTYYNDAAVLEARHGGRAGFARWANANMLVLAQIESRRGHENLDAILAVPGLGGIAGGPFDLAASLGVPGQGDHPEVRRLEAEAAAKARRAGKLVFGDLVARTGAQELVLGAGREFVAAHGRDPVGP
jgi:2-keto-3-deoxy-L-rhamnonate aldolase RhmA